MVTFHKVIEGCAQGRREAWQTFLENYTPLFFRLLAVYLGQGSGLLAGTVWPSVLDELAQDRGERLRALGDRTEKEFLVGLRRRTLQRAALSVDPKLETAPGPPPTSESVQDLLRGLPVLHQEIVFLKLGGYGDAALEKLLRVTPAVAGVGLERLGDRYRATRLAAGDGGLWPLAWLGVLEHAWSSRTEACPALRQLVRIQEGQASWYDREPVEEHLSACLHCLELWTALLEVTYWRREARPLVANDIQPLLARLPLEAASQKRPSWFRRVFR